MDVLRRLTGSLRHDRRGITILWFALIIAGMFALALGALDLIQAHLLRSRMWSAADSAILAAGRTMATDNWQQVGLDYFKANVGDPAGVEMTLTMDRQSDGFGREEVSLALEADISMFSHAILQSPHFSVIPRMKVAASGKALRRTQAVEMVMILDNTGSMGDNNMEALREDAKLLLSTVSDGATTGHLTYAKVGLVPYSAAVNPGKIAAELVGKTAKVDPANPLGWKGCVVERAKPHTREDTSHAEALWGVYAYPKGDDNDYDPKDASTVRPNYFYGNGSTGPNIGCPTPITPLTTDITLLRQNIDAMRHWSRGGTLSDIGMAWGLRVLSPEPPFTEGTAWDNPNIQKVAVLMTDGAAGFFKLTGEASPNKENKSAVTDYTGYGRLDDYNIVGTKDKNRATTIINDNLLELCTRMKGLGVRVYTITFGGLDSTTKGIYKACASAPDTYFDAPNQPALRNAFYSIGGALSELSIIE